MSTSTIGANFRAIYDLSLAGAIGAILGLYLYVELVHTDALLVRDAAAGVAIGGAIGFILNAAGPFRDGAWLRLARSATWGALAGSIGGASGLVLGEFVLGGFRGGVLGRAISWSILGLGIGISQGLANRSMQRLRFGLIGGGLGGFLGGMLFEVLRDRLGNSYTPEVSQALGMVLLGAGLGLCLALVEQALRRAWVVVLNGRQEGRAYLLDNRLSVLGLDEHAAVGLFGDGEIARKHAEIESTSSGYVIRNHDPKGRTRVNGKPIKSESIRDGDKIELGKTMLVFRRK